MEYDVIIIGSGAGGGTLAYSLASTGKRILILERGDYLPREKENWEPKSLFLDNRYTTEELWEDCNHRKFRPQEHYFVGGKTKFYGAALLRLRERDFEEIEHKGGVSPAWPLKYKDFQPYYLKAETLYSVHGERGQDPTEPPESAPYSCPPLKNEPRVQDIFNRLKKEGLHPFSLPIGIRLNEENREKSECIRCDTCDGFPCLVDAKADAHTTCVRKALEHENITLVRRAKALVLNTDPSGKEVREVVVELDGKEVIYRGKTFVISCSAVNSAALLLRSKSDKHPNGLANSSDQVGRHYMCHNNSAIVAVSKTFNPTLFQKTIALNDFYFGAPDYPYPLGHIQLLGKVKKEMLEGDAPMLTPKLALEFMADHSVGWWITTEDLPDPENRVTLTQDGGICLHYTPTNTESHQRLLKKLEEILKNVDGVTHFLPSSIYFAKKIPLAACAHQVGTCRFGTDPKTSVLNVDCRTHDVENLYVVDGSFFPSSSSVNPGLTIIANSLRVADILKDRI